MRGAKARMSARTWTLIVGGSTLLVGIVVLGAMIGSRGAGESASKAAASLTDAGSIVFDLLAAGALLYTAFKFQPRSALRQVWLLLGIGIAVYAVGDIIWTILDARSGFTEVPYPSLADGAYLTMYPLVAAALFRAALAFRRVAKLDVVVAGDTLFMFGIAIVIYWYIGAPIIVDPSSTLLQKVLGVAYPLGDLGALLAPAIFIAIVASLVRKAQPVRHWWALAAGLAVMSFADIAFTWLDWTGRYVSGNPIDYAWMLGLLLIAIAGSMAGDVGLERRPVAVAVTSAAH